MEIKLVVDGATLECSLGTDRSKMSVPQSHGVMVQNKNAANISDCVQNVNIKSFCKCKREDFGNEQIVGYSERTGKPLYLCNPKITTKWVKGKENCTMDGESALLDICVVSCFYGGIIRIKDSGQKEV